MSIDQLDQWSYTLAADDLIISSEHSLDGIGEFCVLPIEGADLRLESRGTLAHHREEAVTAFHVLLVSLPGSPQLATREHRQAVSC